MAENVFATALVRILPDMSAFAATVKTGVTGSVAAAAPGITAEATAVGTGAGEAMAAGVATSFESGMAAFATAAGASFGPIVAEAEVAGAGVAAAFGNGLRSVGATATAASAVINKSIGSTTGALEHLGISSGLLKVAAGAAIAAFAIKGAEHFGNLGLAVEKFHLISGLPEEDASRFLAVANKYGIANDQITRSVGFLGKTLGGNDQALAQYGVQLVRTANGQIDLAKTTFAVIDAYNKSNDTTEKTKLAQVAFGRAYQGIIPLIDVGSKQIIEDFKAVNAAEIFNEEKVAKAKEFRAQVVEMHKSFEALSLNVGQAVLPALTTFSKVITITVGEMSKFDSATNGLSGRALSLAAVLSAAALAFSGLVTVGTKVVNTFTLIKAQLITTEGEMTALATQAAFAAGAVGLLAAAFFAGQWLEHATTNTQKADDAIKQLIVDLGEVNKLQGPDQATATIEKLKKSTDELKDSEGVFSKIRDFLGGGSGPEPSESTIVDQFDRLKKAIDEALALDPGAAKGISDALLQVRDAADNGDESAQKLLTSLGLYDGKAGHLRGRIDELVTHINLAVDAQKELNSENEDGTTVLDGLAQATVINSAMMIRAHDSELKANDALKESNKRLTEEMKPLILTYQEATDSIKAKVAAMSDEATAALGLNNANIASQNADLRLTEATKKYQETLNGIPPSLADIASAQDALTAATEAYHKTTAVTITSDLDKERALIRLQQAQQKLTEATLGASRAEKEAAANSSADALQKYLDVMKDANATALDRQKALTDLHAAQEKQADVEGKGKNADLDRRQAVVDVADAQKAYDDALKGTTGSAEDQAAALKRMEDAQKRLTEVSKGTVFTEDEKRQAYLDVLAAVNNVATAHDNEAKAQATAKGAHYDVRDSILAEIDSLTKIEASLNGPTKTAVDDHITQLQTELGLYDALKGAADALTQNAGYASGYGPRVGPGGGIPQFDLGGMVPGPMGAPMLAIVHGGEIVVPPVGGMAGQGYLKGAPPTHQQPTYAPVVADNANPWPDQMTLVIEGTPFTAMIKREQADLAASIRAGRR